jgi:hypothetical protein
MNYPKRKQRINNQNKNINEKNNVKVNELYNREGSKSTFVTIQNQEENILNISSSPKKEGEKKYYYQTLNGNKKLKEDKKDEHAINKSDINLNKKKRQQNKKNNIIYGNNVNSFDKNNEIYNNNYLGNYFRKSQINSPNLSYYNQIIDEDNNKQLNSVKDNIYNNNKAILSNYNKKDNYNDNNKNELIYKTKKIAMKNSIRKKFSNSFNEELINNDNCSNDNKANEFQNQFKTLVNDKSHQFKININKKNIGIDNNSFIYNNKKKINFTGRYSPNYEFDNKDISYPSHLDNDNDNDNEKEDYFFYNSRTIEDFYKDKNKYRLTIPKISSLKDNSYESSISKNKRKQRILYHKKNSLNHFGDNYSRMSIDVNNNNPLFNKTYYSKKGNKIYLRKRVTDFNVNSTIEIKKYNKEQGDNYNLINSHYSNNIINNNNNTRIKKRNKKNINSSLNINDNKEYQIEKEEISYKINVNEIFEKNHCFFKKYLNYCINKPINKIMYIEKYIINNKKSIKENDIKINNDNVNNISNASESKNNECESFNVSFNINKDKKKN